jgi:hypothetical protein
MYSLERKKDAGDNDTSSSDIEEGDSADDCSTSTDTSVKKGK